MGELSDDGKHLQDLKDKADQTNRTEDKVAVTAALHGLLGKVAELDKEGYLGEDDGLRAAFGNVDNSLQGRAVFSKESLNFGRKDVTAEAALTLGANLIGARLGGRPIILDLDNDGFEFVALESSSSFFDLDSDGFLENAGWLGADDGFLFIDLDGDGTVSNTQELVIANQTPDESDSDLEALAAIYDTNGDGVFDWNDENWASAMVWRDLDQDGESDEGEAVHATEEGITEISLSVTPIPATDQDREGNLLTGISQGADIDKENSL